LTDSPSGEIEIDFGDEYGWLATEALAVWLLEYECTFGDGDVLTCRNVARQRSPSGTTTTRRFRESRSDRPVIMLGPDAGSLTDFLRFRRSSSTTGAIPSSRRRRSVRRRSRESGGRSGVGVGRIPVRLCDHVRAVAGTVERYGDPDGGTVFEYTPADEARSARRDPRRTGYIVVVDLDTGAPAFEARRQSKTFPARRVRTAHVLMRTGTASPRSVP
jgi:hypothetical protein